MEAPRIVLGLGNPGERYRWTRHNVGFRVVDSLAAREGVRFATTEEVGRRVRIANIDLPEVGNVVLAKARTFMNRSGRAAIALCQHYAIEPCQLLVVYDDADRELGGIRLRRSGRAGGHNGIRSLIDALGTPEFPRVKLGVSGEERTDRELADYVLEPFTATEERVVEAMVDVGADAVRSVLLNGLSVAMNQFNGRSVAPVREESEEG